MPKKKYVVDLSTDERTELLTFINWSLANFKKLDNFQVVVTY